MIEAALISLLLSLIFASSIIIAHIFGELRTRKGETKDLLIPDYDPYSAKPYPGNIQPGHYNEKEVQELVKKNKGNVAVLRFIEDMMEE